MRHSEFWAKMEGALGAGYAEFWARAQVLAALGSRTVEEALAQGEPPKQVWRVVADELQLPEAKR